MGNSNNEYSLGLSIGFAILILIAITFIQLGSFPNSETAETKNDSIKIFISSLGNDSDIEGSLSKVLILRGNIKEVYSYKVMLLDEDGAKQMYSFTTKGTKIYEYDELERSYIIVNYTSTTDSIFDIFDIFIGNDNGLGNFIDKKFEINSYEIHIPKGSVTDEYKVDL